MPIIRLLTPLTLTADALLVIARSHLAEDNKDQARTTLQAILTRKGIPSYAKKAAKSHLKKLDN